MPDFKFYPNSLLTINTGSLIYLSRIYGFVVPVKFTSVAEYVNTPKPETATPLPFISCFAINEFNVLHIVLVYWSSKGFPVWGFWYKLSIASFKFLVFDTSFRWELKFKVTLNCYLPWALKSLT